MVEQALNPSEIAEETGAIALAFGLVFALLSATTAMAQVERGANRIYGIPRDRPALHKYSRAAFFMLIAGVPAGLGFVLLVAGGSLGDAAEAVYGWSPAADRTWDLIRWPLGVLISVFWVAVILDHAPRRRQPALSWLALGSAITVALSMIASVFLALYVNYSASFGGVYGPLAGIMALLLWAYMTAIALFYGIAVAAQVEALHANQPDPAEPDPGPPHAPGSSVH